MGLARRQEEAGGADLKLHRGAYQREGPESGAGGQGLHQRLSGSLGAVRVARPERIVRESRRRPGAYTKCGGNPTASLAHVGVRFDLHQ